MIQKYKLPLILSAIAVLYPAACILYGDVIPEAAGLGFDGLVRVASSQDVATHLLNKVQEGKWGAYGAQHSLIIFVLGTIYWLISQFSTTFADALKVNDIPGTDFHANATIGIASFWGSGRVCCNPGTCRWLAIDLAQILP